MTDSGCNWTACPTITDFIRLLCKEEGTERTWRAKCTIGGLSQRGERRAPPRVVPRGKRTDPRRNLRLDAHCARQAVMPSSVVNAISHTLNFSEASPANRLFIWGSDRNPSQIKGPAAGSGGSGLSLTWQHPWRGRSPAARRPGAGAPSASPAAGRHGPERRAASPRSASACRGRRAAS